MRKLVIERIKLFYQNDLAAINQAAYLEMTSLEELNQLSDEDLLEMYDVCVVAM